MGTVTEESELLGLCPVQEELQNRLTPRPTQGYRTLRAQRQPPPRDVSL